jgi:hypothetical protein
VRQLRERVETSLAAAVLTAVIGALGVYQRLRG